MDYKTADTTKTTHSWCSMCANKFMEFKHENKNWNETLATIFKHLRKVDFSTYTISVRNIDGKYSNFHKLKFGVSFDNYFIWVLQQFTSGCSLTCSFQSTQENLHCRLGIVRRSKFNEKYIYYVMWSKLSSKFLPNYNASPSWLDRMCEPPAYCLPSLIKCFGKFLSSYANNLFTCEFIH